MSHVSENALRNFDEVDRLRLQFADEIGGESPSLSEIAAYYLVGSAGFSRLLKMAQELASDHELPAEAIPKIQQVIIGRPISKKIPLLHELISGPFDCDKLDYMTRDAQMTGVPVVTDIPRLIQKVRAVELSLDKLPEKVKQLVTVEAGPSYWLTGISMSGGRTLDELMIGKILLFDKLYRHHKVRACEAMVASIYRAVGAIHHDGPAMLPYHLDDAQILELDESRCAELVGRPLDDDELERSRVAADIAKRLKDRRLFVRAYAFAQNMPLDGYRGVSEHANGLRRLARTVADQQRRGELVDSIVDELSEILQRLSLSDLLDKLPTDDLKPYIWIDPPQPPTETTDVARAFLISDDGEVIRFREDYAEAPSWTNAYLLTRDVGYVFTTAELAPYVFVAVERVLREQFGIRSPRSMYAYAKQSGERIDEIKRELSGAGHYSSLPYDLRPLPQVLSRGDTRGALDRVVNRLHAYEGPVESPGDERGAPSINLDRLVNWLRQFEDEELIDAGVRALDHIQFFGRTELVAALDEFLMANDQFRGGTVAPLGDPKDSSNVLVYHSLDLRDKHDLEARTLVEAIALRRPIVFVDDFVGSGGQSVSIIESWFGVEPTTRLGEERGDPFNEELQEAARTTPMAFVFSAGLADGVAALQARTADLGLDATVFAKSQSLPCISDYGIYKDGEQGEAFVERSREIGLSLLADDDRRVGRALGYGNLGLLVLFPHNAPAQSLTALWAGGEWNGVPWEPLVPRRKKH
jgi:HD superfamily phosphohydrolase